MAIHFVRAWEDDRLDLDLLRVEAGQRALVVAGAGDLALALAAGGASVIAVDHNPDQLRLARLKLAASRSLTPLRLHAWFEGAGGTSVGGEYRGTVRPRLDASDAAWWDARLAMIERGLGRSTGVGRPFGWLGRLARLVVPDLAAIVERIVDPAAQVAVWRDRVAPRLFGRPTHWLLAHTPVLGPLAPNRQERRRIRAGGWSHGLVDRIDGVVSRHLVRELPWWRPFASGRVVDPGNGAAWLDEDRVTRLAEPSLPATIDLRLGDLIDALEGVAPRSLDAISLSNVPDWLDPSAEARLAGAAWGASAPGARLVVRHVVSPAGEDPYERAGFARDPVSATLPSRDRTALYEAVDLYRA